MSQGRGSAAVATAAAMVVLCVVVLSFEGARAATYMVGGADGWTFNAVNWPQSKQFRAGDILVFKYKPSVHNVVRVNRVGYDNCRAPVGSKVYQTGNDKMRLVRGQNFFICSLPDHCESQMKIAIKAS